MPSCDTPSYDTPFCDTPLASHACGITFDIWYHWCQRQGVQSHLVPFTTFAIAAHQLIHNVHTGCDEREEAQECRISQFH